MYLSYAQDMSYTEDSIKLPNLPKKLYPPIGKYLNFFNEPFLVYLKSTIGGN